MVEKRSKSTAGKKVVIGNDGIDDELDYLVDLSID